MHVEATGESNLLPKACSSKVALGRVGKEGPRGQKAQPHPGGTGKQSREEAKAATKGPDTDSLV